MASSLRRLAILVPLVRSATTTRIVSSPATVPRTPLMPARSMADPKHLGGARGVRNTTRLCECANLDHPVAEGRAADGPGVPLLLGQVRDGVDAGSPPAACSLMASSPSRSRRPSSRVVMTPSPASNSMSWPWLVHPCAVPASGRCGADAVAWPVAARRYSTPAATSSSSFIDSTEPRAAGPWKLPCIRLCACSKMRLRGRRPRMRRLLPPRCTGRQCMKMPLVASAASMTRVVDLGSLRRRERRCSTFRLQAHRRPYIGVHRVRGLGGLVGMRRHERNATESSEPVEIHVGSDRSRVDTRDECSCPTIAAPSGQRTAHVVEVADGSRRVEPLSGPSC